MKLPFLLPLLLAASPARAVMGPVASKPKELPLKGVVLVRVSADSGSILVRDRKADTAMVMVVGSLDNCAITTEVRGSELVVEARHRFMKVCAAGFAVEVSGTLPLHAYTGSGDIEVVSRKASVEADAGSGRILVKDGSGELVLKSGSGDITADAASPSLRAQTGSGKVEMTGLKGPASVITGSGNIRLRWSQAPRTGTVEVRSGSGDVELVFPQGTRLAAELRTGAGSSSNEFAPAPEAKLRVAVMAGTGNVSIRAPGTGK